MIVQRSYVMKTDGDPFEEFEAAVEQLEVAQGITFEFDEADSPDGAITQYVFYEFEGTARVTLVDDPDTPARYFTVESRDVAIADRIATGLLDSVPVWSWKELTTAARLHFEADPGSLVRMALASGDNADSKMMEVLESAAHHDDRDVRISAIEALSLTQWQEAADLLAQIRDDDPDGEIRDYARNGIEGLSQGRADHGGHGVG